MTKIFYWHLVELSPIKAELASRGVGETDLLEILDHVEEIIHHRTLSLIYDRLPAEHHREFSYRLAKNPPGKEIWGFINKKAKQDLSPEIKNNIRKVIIEILNEMEFDKQAIVK